MYIGRIFAAIYLFLTPVKKPNQKYFLLCLIQLMICGSVYLCINNVGEYQKVSLIITNILIGIVKAISFFPYVILTEYYNSENV